MKEYFEIVDIMGRRILDSHGNMTVEAEITLDDGTMGRASVPECDDNPENINTEIAEALLGLNAVDQSNIDGILLDVDGSENCRRLGAGTIFATSMACAKAAAEVVGLSLYSYIGGVNAKTIPLPVIDLYGDGDYYLIPAGADSFLDAICMCKEATNQQEDEEFPKDDNACVIVSSSELRERFEFVSAEECQTITMLLDKIDVVRKDGCIPILVSSDHESDDCMLADIAVAANVSLICFGTPGTPGSSSKYNEIIRIEEELSDRAVFVQWEKLKN